MTPRVGEWVHPPYGPTLRRFRPPWPVRVLCEAGSPVRLEAGRLEGEVRLARGPWLGSGDWWKPGSWALETWQIELSGGGLYQIARSGETWSVEGMLD